MAYDPKNDSSPGTQAVRDREGFAGVILHRTDPANCLCGCDQPPMGTGRKFRMGHDARYRGILIRAYVAGAQVAIYDGGGLAIHDADELANELDWCQYLETAKRREDRKLEEKLERANTRLVEQATGPQVGDLRLVRVGRWEYTGQVICVFEDDDTIEFRYVTKSGEAKRVVKPRAEYAELAVPEHMREEA